MTTFENKCLILGDLWMSYRGDEEFKDFMEYNDLGLPIAYAISSGIVQSLPLAEQFINETFEMLLVGLELEDIGFDSLDQILDTGI
jgi:hypothetical protein